MIPEASLQIGYQPQFFWAWHFSWNDSPNKLPHTVNYLITVFLHGHGMRLSRFAGPRASGDRSGKRSGHLSLVRSKTLAVVPVFRLPNLIGGTQPLRDPTVLLFRFGVCTDCGTPYDALCWEKLRQHEGNYAN